MRSDTSLRLHATGSGKKLLKVSGYLSGYLSVLIDTTKKRICSKTASLSCKFSKPVASFPGLPKFFEGLVPRLHGSRALALCPSLVPRIWPA